MTGVARGDTMISLLERRAAECGDAPFLTFEGEGTHSYAQFWDSALRLAGGLLELGIERGRTVAMLLDNSIDSATMWFATNVLAGVDVQINTAYKGDFLAHQLNDCAAELVVAEAAYVARIADIEGCLKRVKVVVCRGPVPPDVHFSGITLLELDDFRASDATSPVALRSDELSTLVYTAGTTGPSKGCMIGHSYVLSMAGQTVRATQLGRDDVTWTPLPMFHMNAKAGTVVGALLVGGHAAFVRKFSLNRFWQNVGDVAATRAKMLGSMLSLVAFAADTQESEANTTLRYVIGSPVTPDISRAYEDRWGIKAIAPGYGLTEAAILVTVEGLETGPLGSSGRANEEFDVRIVDDNDEDVAQGESGEIVARPKKPGVMFSGYWGRDGDTLRMLRNLWLHTGDIGRVDQDGWFYFVDRKKDYLRRRGENVSTYEVESTFVRHEAISEVAVFGVPSELTEDEIKVAVVLNAGMHLTAAELCEWSIDKVPYFAVPRYIEVVDELPKNPFGRVLKYRLQEKGVAGDTWDREASGLIFERR